MSSFLKKLFPRRNDIESIFETFSRTKWIIFILSSAIFIITVFTLVFELNQKILVGIPSHGGQAIEGIIGTPRFINPLLALSDADKDLAALVYSGLIRRDADGQLIPDLAESYEISTDGLTYTFIIKDAAVFHDGKKVTSEDVAYTIALAKDPLIKSPKKVNWDGVTVTTPDSKTVVLSLKRRYASFLDTATLGIIPMHLWKNITTEQFGLSTLNSDPIGSGPFQIKKINQNSAGVPTSYTLTAFSKFVLGKPYLDEIKFLFYSNKTELINAFKNRKVTAINSISPKDATLLTEKNFNIKTTTLPRIFGLYFDATENKLFTDTNVVAALELAISKKEIVDTVLDGYGSVIDSPIPESLKPRDPQEPVIDQNIEKAISLLEKSGWVKNQDGLWQKKTTVNKKSTTINLSFAISTSDTPELKDAANQIKDMLTVFGAQVEVKVFEMGALNQNVIRPRKFEALFFGQVINHDTDLFAFWHSSQRNDPGLNIAQYVSARADKDLENASGTLDPVKRAEFYDAFVYEVKKDKPAIFIYSPTFTYATNSTIKGNDLGAITAASDRFATVWKWYQHEERVWPIFAKKI